MVHSEILDDWLRHRPSNIKDDSALTRRTIRDHSQFLWIELETGRQFARLAKNTKHDHIATRRRNAARVAYDTIQRFLFRPPCLPESELQLFRSELRGFRQELEQLGETFDPPK